MSKRAIGRIMMLMGLVFILVGFQDSIYSYFARGKVDKETTELLQEALKPNGEGDEEEVVKETIWKTDFEEYEPTEYRKENSKEQASKGLVILPTINQRISVMDGVGGNNMFRGAGEQYEGAKMGQGNYVLASHRMKDGSLFSKLEEVEIGEFVYVTDYDTVWKYVVEESDNRVETSRVGLLKDTEEPIMTIYSCTVDSIMRVVKQAKLVGHSKLQDLSEEDKAIISE